MTTPISPSTTASNSLPVGTHLGEFEITGFLGEGGFGIVYSAHDSSLDRIVAIKEYLPSAFSLRTDEGVVQVKSADHSKTFAAGLSSFIKEAKMLARFSHPGLVEVFRFWEANGTAYMAMRYYRGVTLRELLRTTPQIVTEQWLCETLDPLLLALKELHTEKCYHRDIAPDNILVSPNGRSVLMDFGASRRIISGMTQALTTVLKPGFAPIEQYSDDGSMPQGAWTDIYAIGGLLYHAMTGKIPVQAISRMMSDPLKPVAELARGSFSTQLCSVVMKCLAVQPTERFQSVDELRAALGWVTTPGVSTVVQPGRATQPVAQEYPATVILQTSSAADEALPASIFPFRMEISDVLATDSEPEFDPLATVITKPPVPKEVGGSSAASGADFDPLATVITKAFIPKEVGGSGAASGPEFDPLATVITKAFIPKEVGGSGAASGPEFDPLATVITKAFIPKEVGGRGAASGPEFDPLATVITKAPVRNEGQRVAATPAGLSRRSRAFPIASIAIAAIVLAGVAVFFYSNSHKRDDAVAATAPRALEAVVAAPALVAPVTESRETPSVRENPAPPAADSSSSTPAPALGFPGGGAPDNTAQQQARVVAPAPVAGKDDTVHAVTTGNVRFELKDGWGTVFVDGDQKGTAPPVITVKLSPGTHVIELRNPALPTVKRTVEVIAGKTVVVRHVFTK